MLNHKFLIGTVIGVSLFAVVLSTIWYFDASTKPAKSSPAQVVYDPDHSVGSASFAQEMPPRKHHIAWASINDAATVDRSIWRSVPADARFVSLSQEFDQWLINTPLQLHIPQIETSYEAIVDRILPGEFGGTTIYAKPVEEESDFERLILTYNEVDTMAYITTNTGSWELNGNHSVAWIVSSRDLKKKQDYSKPDLLNRNEFRYANAEYVPRAVPE